MSASDRSDECYADPPGSFHFTMATAHEKGKIAAKRIRPNETIQYDEITWWKFRSFFCPLGGMAGFLRELAERRDRAILRGSPKPGLDLALAWRRRLREDPPQIATLDDVDRASLVLDVDGATVPEGMGDGDRLVDAALYVRDHLLPPEFRGVRMIASVTASTGLKGPSLARLRLFALLDRPIPSPRLYRWAKGCRAANNVPLDPAALIANQCIYTARPYFQRGAVDPVPTEKRVAILAGDRDRVALVLDRYEAVARAADRRTSEAKTAAGGAWRDLMERTVGVSHDGEVGDFAGTFFEPLSCALGVAARSDDAEEEICTFVAELLAERASPDRQRQYGRAWVIASVRRFRDKDECRRAAEGRSR
jgi:hypothetical protein